MINKAREKETEQRMWEEYLSIRPNMTKENYQSFPDYKDSYLKPKTKRSGRSKNEIIERAKRIAELDRKGA